MMMNLDVYHLLGTGCFEVGPFELYDDKLTILVGTGCKLTVLVGTACLGGWSL